MRLTNHPENGLQAPYRVEGILCYRAQPAEASVPKKTHQHKKEALLSESILCVDSAYFRQLARINNQKNIFNY
jgi:hypothetical protein